MKIKTIGYGLAALILLSSCNTTTPTQASFSGYRYGMSLLLPPQWKDYTSEADTVGHFKVYRPISTSIHVAQYVGMTYDSRHVSLKQAMSDMIASNTKSANCRHIATNIIAQKPNTITFAIVKENCTDISDEVTSVHKIFSMPDGNYSVTYVADPRVVSSEQMQQLQAVVEGAQLVRSSR